MQQVKIKKLKALKIKKESAEKLAKEAASAYEELRLEVLGDMNKDGLESLKSNGLSLSVSKQVVVEVQDWEEYYKYIHRYKAYDLLQRRIGSRAVLDRLESGKKVPGVETKTIRKLNVRKAT